MYISYLRKVAYLANSEYNLENPTILFFKKEDEIGSFKYVLETSTV